MKLELHILQNFAPANLNRDDTGAPKDCEFGGYRRARVSSQCLKRSIRVEFESADLPTDQHSARTKRLVTHIAERIRAEMPKLDGDAAEEAAKILLGTCGLKTDEDLKTQYLLFLPRRAIDALAAIAVEHWSVLADQLAEQKQAEPAPDAAKEKKSAQAKAKAKKEEKQKAKDALPKEVADKVEAVLEDARHVPALALFGRMIADKPDWNVDAACQVAHAISTNRVSMEFDYYTAVDDLKPDEDAGSDMIGTVQFNSSCFYRYSVVDLDRLSSNLGNSDLVRDTIQKFVWASIRAIPTGKQNSMAAQNPPSFVLAVLRNGAAPVSLTNAFVKPVKPTAEHDLVSGSIDQLSKQWERIGAVYGDAPQLKVWADRDLPHGTWSAADTVGKPADLVTWLANSVAGPKS